MKQHHSLTAHVNASAKLLVVGVSTNSLKGVCETLLITLAARAKGSAEQLMNGFSDKFSEYLCKHYSLDMTRYASSKSTVLGTIARSVWFDSRIDNFLRHYPKGTILTMGCGMGTLYERAVCRHTDGQWQWIDTDLEEVITLRSQLFKDGFTNIHRLIKPGGKFTFAAWCALYENEWVMAPILAVSEHLKKQPNSTGDGPFSFADKNDVENILKSSGWKNIRIERWVGNLQFPTTSVDVATEFLMQIGPLARMIKSQHLDEVVIREKMRSFSKLHTNPLGTMVLGAKAWIVTANA